LKLKFSSRIAVPSLAVRDVWPDFHELQQSWRRSIPGPAFC
jgi:hypothetical protein